MKPNLDTSIFSVICELDKCLYTPEFELADMRKQILVNDIRNGQYEQVKAVLEFNPAEGWCNDITEDVLSEAFPDLQDPEEDTLEDTLEDWADYEAERIDSRRAGITARAAA